MRVFFFITFLASIILYLQKDEKKLDEIHLSYNLLNSESKKRKYLDAKGYLNFYIANEHFRTNQTPIKLGKDELKYEKLVNINSFINISNQKREELIKKGEKNGVIKILTNSEIFKIIFLYEKKEKNVYRYKVKWIEEIIN